MVRRALQWIGNDVGVEFELGRVSRFWMTFPKVSEIAASAVSAQLWPERHIRFKPGDSLIRE